MTSPSRPEQMIVFSTREYAQARSISISGAARRLNRLEAKGELTRLTRGIWADTNHPYFNAYGCVPKLLGNEQGYISFLTALHIHGALSQIPATIQVATTGHTRRITTPVATFEFLQLKTSLFTTAIEWSDTPLTFLMANVEKALFDTLYIATRKHRRFSSLPELDLEDAGFSDTTFRRLFQCELPAIIARAMLARYECRISGSQKTAAS